MSDVPEEEVPDPEGEVPDDDETTEEDHSEDT